MQIFEFPLKINWQWFIVQPHVDANNKDISALLFLKGF